MPTERRGDVAFAPPPEQAELAARQPWEAPFSDDDLAIYSRYQRPRREPFPWTACALLIVDVTTAFVGPRLPTLAAAAINRTACGEPAWEALPKISGLLTAFRSAGRPIAFTRGASERGLGGVTIGAAVDNESDEIVAEVRPRGGELTIAKPRASAFFGTPLVSWLVRSGIAGVVVVGATTSGCVRATVIDGSSYGFRMAVAHDACFDRVSVSHLVALKELDVKYADVLNTSAVIAAVREGSAAADAASQRNPDPIVR